MYSYILAIVVIGYSLYRWFMRNADYFEKRGLISPRPTFPFGSIPKASMQKINVAYEIDEIYQKYRKQPFVGIFEMRTPKLLLIDPNVIKDVTVKHFSHFRDNGFGKLIDKKSDPIFGRNPFMLEGDEWKEKRAEVTPAFTSSRIKALFPLVEEILHRFSKYLNEQHENGPLDAREISAKFTTDVVSSCIFNADAQSFTKEKPEIREMGRRIFNIQDPKIFIQFVLFSIFPFISKIYKMNFVSKEITEFFTDLMKQAVTLREKEKINREDYLAHLITLRNKKNLSELDMAAHAVTFFIDGFETSSIAICHTFYEIANSKKVQDKLRKIINSEIVDQDGKIVYEKLLDNEYLDQVFYEALRLHPPVAATIRECNEEIVLESGNERFRVEKGLGLSIPFYSIHRDPEYFPNPDEFIPERFNPEHGGVKAFEDRGVLIPFGYGPRICLGRKFALMQSKAVIAHIVRNFEMSVNIKTQRPLVIDPKEFLNVKVGGIWLDFKPIL